MASISWICILLVYILCTRAVFTQDCSSNLRNIQTPVTIKETDPKGTLITQFESSFTKVVWSASMNGSYRDAISGYLHHEVDDEFFRLVLSKKVDLEFISTDLRMNIGDSGIEITIELTCRESFGDSAAMPVSLIVSPVNEFFPAFIRAPYDISVRENTPIGAQVFTFDGRVIDMDVGNHAFSFQITPYMISQFDGRGLFRIDAEGKGDIFTAAEIDFEQLPRSGRNYYFLNVTVMDEGNFTQSTAVKVTVEDANDQSIEFVYPGCSQTCDGANVSFSAETNESYVGILDLVPVPIRARDLDTLQENIEYYLILDKASEYFQIDRHTGELYKSSPLTNDSLGYEIVLQVLVREESDASHNITAYITILITERIPTTGERRPRTDDDQFFYKLTLCFVGFRGFVPQVCKE